MVLSKFLWLNDLCKSLSFRQLENSDHSALTGYFILSLYDIVNLTIANQPITWQQLNLFRHVDMVKRRMTIKLIEMSQYLT